MKVLVDVRESKALFLMELLNNFSFVKVQPLTNEKALLLREIKESVDAVNLVKRGEMSARSAKDLLNEL
ncbi:MAG: hypothetical protein FWD02_03910 [Bacteroidales bacterium]|nr:hypothetical protein [Bacteroidales bacterium]